MDPAHQRAGARARPDLRPIYPRPEARGRSSSTARSWPTSPSTTGRRSRASSSRPRPLSRRDPARHPRVPPSLTRKGPWQGPFLLCRCREEEPGWTPSSGVCGSGIMADLAAAADLRALDEVRVAALGKKGCGHRAGEGLAARSRPSGAATPGRRSTSSSARSRRRSRPARPSWSAPPSTPRLAAERLDVTLPARERPEGRLHPVSQVTDEITAIFADMGFAVAEGPGRRGRLAQFRGAQHPARAPGAADARHLLPRGRADGRAAAAAHPHQPGADPHHAGRQAALPDHRARAAPTGATST